MKPRFIRRKLMKLRLIRLFGVHTLVRKSHPLPKPTAHGVPALAGQTRFRPRSREEWSRLQETTPRRLKPGLHALIKAAMVVQPCVSSFGYEIFGLGCPARSTLKRGHQTPFRLVAALAWLAAASLQAATLYEVSQRHPQASDDGHGSRERPWKT